MGCVNPVINFYEVLGHLTSPTPSRGRDNVNRWVSCRSSNYNKHRTKPHRVSLTPTRTPRHAISHHTTPHHNTEVEKGAFGECVVCLSLRHMFFVKKKCWVLGVKCLHSA